MVIVSSYTTAVLLCLITMLCWGSWANTQKLAGRKWPFQLYYWDYAIGVFLFSLFLAFTLGSNGTEGRSFLQDLAQAEGSSLTSAFLGGVIFNLSNILLVAAIDIAGMAVAFPIGVGLALAVGVITTYMAKPEGNPYWLFFGVAGVVLAILLDALAYKRLSSRRKATGKGILLSLSAGILMGFFYRFVVTSMSADFAHLEAGKLGPYTALVFFSAGLLLSNFLWNTLVMLRPFQGDPVSPGDYFRKGNLPLHLTGILGGVIWNLGMSFSILASSAAGPAISYGLGQGATMIAAFWGVFIWKEFRDAPAGTARLLIAMFVFYLLGLSLIVAARIA